MPERFSIRPIRESDFAQWLVLWEGYNAFYERSGPTALPQQVTASTWAKFFSPNEYVHACVAQEGDLLVGIAHYLFHRSTTRLQDVCYLQDLFTAEPLRGLGVGRQLIEAVYEAARAAGSTRVYWQTHASNHEGRLLYDKVAKHHGHIVYSLDL